MEGLGPGDWFALLSALGFAGSNVLVRAGQNHRSGDNGDFFLVTTVSAIVFALSTLVLILTGGLPPIVGWGLGAFVLAGTLTSFLGRTCFYASIRRIGPSRAGAYKKTSPIFVLILAVTFLDETVSALSLGGAVLTLAGLFLLTRDTRANQAKSLPAEGPGFRSDAARGIMLGVMAAMAYASGHLFRKIGLNLIPAPLVGALLGTLAAWCFAAGHVVVRQGARALVPQKWTRSSWLYPGAGLCVCLGQLSSFFAIKHAQVWVASLVGSSETLMTMGLSALFLGSQERLNAGTLFSMTVTVAGLVMVMLG